MSRRFLAMAAMALIVLAVGIPAHADLLVTVENGINGINRYDEVSGAFLGTFAPEVLGGIGLVFKDRNEALLYVSDDASGDVLRFNMNGDLNGNGGVSLGVFAYGIGVPRFLIFGPDGNLYVSSLLTASIVRFNGNNGSPLGTFATAPGMFPEGLVFGPDGNLYVSDEVNNYVLRFNGTTGALIGTFASGPELNFPFCLTFSRPRGKH